MEAQRLHHSIRFHGNFDFLMQQTVVSDDDLLILIILTPSQKFSFCPHTNQANLS